MRNSHISHMFHMKENKHFHQYSHYFTCEYEKRRFVAWVFHRGTIMYGDFPRTRTFIMALSFRIKARFYHRALFTSTSQSPERFLSNSSSYKVTYIYTNNIFARYIWECRVFFMHISSVFYWMSDYIFWRIGFFMLCILIFWLYGCEPLKFRFFVSFFIQSSPFKRLPPPEMIYPR